MYGSTDVSQFRKDTQRGSDTHIKLSSAFTSYCQKRQWSKATAQKILTIFRKIASHLQVPRASTIKLLTAHIDHNSALGKKYGGRPADDKTRLMLESWIVIIKKTTKNKSDLSMRNIMCFLLSACEHLRVDIDNWHDGIKEQIENNLSTELIMKIISGKEQKLASAAKKAAWFQTFLTHVIGSKWAMTQELRGEIKGYAERDVKAVNADEDADEDPDEDKHRFTKEQLDSMHKFAKII